MAFTQANLEAVESALAAGELSISLGDMRITYRTTNELLAQRDLIRAELQASGVLATPTRVSYASRSRE